jgi:hypothetical protein
LANAAQEVGGVGAVNAGNTVGCCGEFRAANQLMPNNPSLNATDIKFTDAIRPGQMTTVAPCQNCKTIFKFD